MKLLFKLLSFILFIGVFSSCTEEVPFGYVKYQGKNYKEPVPVKYDSNGDGQITAADESIEVLGNSLDFKEQPNGGPLYTSTTDINSGKALCYQNVSSNCDKFGALYSIETSLNASWDSLYILTHTQMEDTDNNYVWDYVDDLRSSATIQNIVNSYYVIGAASAKALIDQAIEFTAPGVKMNQSVLEVYISEAIIYTLQNEFARSYDNIDIVELKIKLRLAVADAIINAINDVDYDQYISDIDLENIMNTVSTSVSDNITLNISTRIFDALVLYNNNSSIPVVQGLCPSGYHIPSDLDWMIFELALGMSKEDVVLAGEEVITRGSDVSVAEQMILNHGFTYSGYLSENGNFAQLNEAGVFISSSVGEDEDGAKYVWVRQIDESYEGVIRYKHYGKSGLSIRCFKN